MLPKSLRVVLGIVLVLTLGGGLLPQSATKTGRKGINSRADVASAGIPDAQKTIRKIDIDSTLDFGVNVIRKIDIHLPLDSGVNAPASFQNWSAVFIHRGNGGFRRLLRGKGAGSIPDEQAIDAALIEALRVALNEPPIRKPDLKNLGITPDWFKEYRSAALNNQIPSSAPKQVIARFFSSPAVLQRVVRGMFNDRGGEFTDLRFIRFTVTFDGDSELSFQSASHFSPFMLPWDVTKDGKEIKTYNANISRALTALMPPESMNREYVSGQLFPVEVVDAVRDYIESTRRQRKTHADAEVIP